jgi:hypothetical protein
MNDNWWLYVNRDTLQICKVSATLEEDLTSHIIAIEKEVGVEFINSPHLIYDYVVYFDGVKAHFVKKDKTKEVLVPFFYSPLMIGDAESNVDILLEIKDQELTISLRPELKQYAMTMFANVDKQKQKVEFYVSAKNDPNHLIEIIQVDMMKLIAADSLTFKFNHDHNRISFFTRKIFDSYGLKS